MGYPDGEILEYGYDAAGQLAIMVGEKDGNHYDYLKDVRYDEFGRITSKTLGNDSRETMSFDPLTQRPVTTKVTANGGTLQDLLQTLTVRHDQAFRQLVLDSSGKLLPSILLCIDDQQIDVTDRRILNDGTVVTFLSAISGG